MRELPDVDRSGRPDRVAASEVAVRRIGAGHGSRVRFQFLYGPASLHPQRMGWALTEAATPTGHWYGWRLIGANNRELGRSATIFVSYPLARESVALVQQDADRLVAETIADRGTGRWRWHVDLNGVTVSVSGRWYERGHDSRLAMSAFVRLCRGAAVVDGVLTLRDRHAPVLPRWASEVSP